MKKLEVLLVLVLASLLGVKAALPTLAGLHRRYEFQQSFKPPYVANSKGLVPFWEHGGDAIATAEQVRLCPSMHDRRGFMWNKNKFQSKNWMFDASLRISGRTKVGADGMAFWFTEEKGGDGAVFGNVEGWKGIALILDSFDNNGRGDNPRIMLFQSNGSVIIDNSQDGINQQSGGCNRDFRNKPHPVKIQLSYIDRSLMVWVHDGSSEILDDYELCLKLDEIDLPAEGYFGISAATGGLSDDHDILSFEVHSLRSLKEFQEKALEQAEIKRQEEIAKEYDKMVEEFKQKREIYKKAHPPSPGKYSTDSPWDSGMYLDDNVRMVSELQGTIVKEMRDLSGKLDQITSTRSQETPGGGASTGDISAMEGRMNHHFSELRAQLEKTAPSGQLTASEQLQPIYELKAKMQEMTNKIAALEQLMLRPCPTAPSSCMSSWFFTVVIMLQTLAILGTLFYKYAQERNAKKFF